jgi:hypothetical protein
MEIGVGSRLSLNREVSSISSDLNQFSTIIKFGVIIMASSTNRTPSSSDRNGWRWGFTPQAERLNGRLAMIGFVSALLIELLSAQGILHFLNLS